MKKLTVILLTAALSLSIVGCGSSNGENGGSETESSQETSTAESQPESVEESSQPDQMPSGTVDEGQESLS